MKKYFSIFTLLFFSLSSAAQDEHVLLTLGLDSVFSKLTDKEPGGSVYIQQGGQILYSKSFGLANLKTKEKFTENTVSNIGSVTETFIAYSILILQKQSKLSIEDSIGKYFPGIKNKEVAKIQIKHLLTHTSGLPNNLDKEITQSLKLIEKPDFEPGSNYKYSATDFNLLTAIINNVSKVKWQDFSQKNIFDHTGMINTTIKDENNKNFEATLGYHTIDKKPVAINSKCVSISTSCNTIWTSVNNLRKYINAINECVFLDCKTLKNFSAIWQPVNWRRSEAPPKGFAWFTHGEKEIVMEYESKQNGYVANVMMYQQSGIMIIYLGNNNISYKEAIIKRLMDLKYIK